MNKVVVACFGDTDSVAEIASRSATSHVIAVALDLGGAVTLSSMRDAALAAGAVRCHAFDAREEFARAVLLPAIGHREYPSAASAVAALVSAFVARKLAEIAVLEDAEVVVPARISVPARRLHTAVSPRRLAIAFEDGLPVAVNGVPMTLTELLESVETITGEPALYVLEREMARSREHQLA